MPITTERIDNLLLVDLKGRISRSDYDDWIRDLARAVKETAGIRVLVHTTEFDGWDVVGSSWESFRLQQPSLDNVERIAVIGDTDWRNWMAGFGRTFNAAEVRFFASEEADRACRWLHVEHLADRLGNRP